MGERRGRGGFGAERAVASLHCRLLGFREPATTSVNRREKGPLKTLSAPWQTAIRHERRRRRLVAGRVPLTRPRKTTQEMPALTSTRRVPAGAVRVRPGSSSCAGHIRPNGRAATRSRLRERAPFARVPPGRLSHRRRGGAARRHDPPRVPGTRSAPSRRVRIPGKSGSGASWAWEAAGLPPRHDDGRQRRPARPAHC